jgi:hypothetical protein
MAAVVVVIRVMLVAGNSIGPDRQVRADVRCALRVAYRSPASCPTFFSQAWPLSMMSAIAWQAVFGR